MDAVELLLEEYKALRQEVVAAMSNRIATLTFGLASIGAILAASILTTKSGVLPGVMLALLVPTIAILVLFMWLGEYERMQRAGTFLMEIEARINREEQRRLLTWESHLRFTGSHMKSPYKATVSLLLLIGLISSIVGLINIGSCIPGIWVDLTTWDPCALATWIRITECSVLLGFVAVHWELYDYVNRRVAELRL